MMGGGRKSCEIHRKIHRFLLLFSHNHLAFDFYFNFFKVLNHFFPLKELIGLFALIESKSNIAYNVDIAYPWQYAAHGQLT